MEPHTNMMSSSIGGKSLVDRLLFHTINDDDRNRVGALLDFQSKLFFEGLEDRKAARIERSSGRTGVSGGGPGLFQCGPRRPVEREIPATLKAGCIDDRMIEISSGDLREDSREFLHCRISAGTGLHRYPARVRGNGAGIGPAASSFGGVGLLELHFTFRRLQSVGGYL